MPPLDRKHLAMLLSRAPPHPRPRPELEQVRTPGPIAAELLLAASERGDLKGKEVADLGCGTGVFSLGAALLGAKSVIGFDIDETAIEMARDYVHEGWKEVTGNDDPPVKFKRGDITTVTGTFDTVVMNPPFGAQRASRERGGDALFLAKAFRVSHGAVWSLHLADTERFLGAFARDATWRCEPIDVVDFPVPASFEFHKRQRQLFRVGIYRFVPLAAP